MQGPIAALLAIFWGGGRRKGQCGVNAALQMEALSSSLQACKEELGDAGEVSAEPHVWGKE